MKPIVATTSIARPRNDVFAAFCDLSSSSERIAGIDRVDLLTEGSFGVGTRWRETRIMFGKEATEEMWVTAYRPDDAYEVDAESRGTHYHSVLSFEDEGTDSTRVTMAFGARPITPLAKAFSLVAFLFIPMTRKMLQRDLNDMRAALEQGPSS